MCINCERGLFSIIMSAIAFVVLFLAYTTIETVVKTVLNSVQDDDPNFKGDGFISLSILYIVFALFNWFAPSAIYILGPNMSMTSGSVFYVLFIAGFLYPNEFILYFTSAGVGIGAALIWTGQSEYMIHNSDKETLGRNAGIFWALLQIKFFGNLFSFFQFKSKTHIDDYTRRVLAGVLTIVGVIGIILFVFLPKVKKKQEESVDENSVKLPPKSPFVVFIEVAKLFVTIKLILLIPLFFYTGIIGSFISIHAAAIGFTLRLGKVAKSLVGLSGAFVGVGNILGGILVGIKPIKKLGKTIILTAGFVTHLLTYLLVFFNIPNKAAFADTEDEAILESNMYIALFCSFSLGLGDAFMNTQIYVMVGTIFHANSAAAFSLFKFLQCVAASLGFFGAIYLDMYPLVIIATVSMIIGYACFLYIDRTFKKEEAFEQTATDANKSE